MNEKQLKQYDKFDKQRQEISFCEKYILAINNMYPKYMNKFYSIKSDKNLSVRDYTFSFENWLFVELDNEAYYEYMKGLKLYFQDKILKCDQAIQKFKGANNVFRYMIELTKFEGKEEIALGMIFNLHIEALMLLIYHIIIGKIDLFHKCNFMQILMIVVCIY